MASPPTELLEMILRECAAARPQPWYPADYTQGTGVPRDDLDASLDQLRLGGLIRLTDWIPGKGQGYTLTPAGERVLDRPRLLGQLRGGAVPAVRTGPPPGPTWQEDKPPGWERAKAVKAALLDSARPVITLGLLGANFLVFLFGLQMAARQRVTGDYLSLDLKRPPPAVTEIYHQVGALHGSDVVARGQWWRLLSNCFVHFGLIHLAMNMYALWVLGPMLERMWGRWRFLLLYLVSGLGGSCAVVVTNPGVLLAGASGALCGILASMATWVFLNRPYLPAGMAADWMRRILTNAILIVFISLIPGVSGAAHFGGAAAGLVAAVPLTYSRFGHGWQPLLGLLGFLAVPVALLGWVDQSLTPRTEVGRAQARYGQLLQDLMQTAYETYNQHVVPLYNQGMKDHAVGADEARAALDQVAKTLEELHKGAQDLAQAPTYEDARINRALVFAREYVDSWIEFFERFRRCLDAQGHWRSQEARGLLQLYEQRIQGEEKNLKDSVLAPGR
jgi:membrane associated rhomboid family serine protease